MRFIYKFKYKGCIRPAYLFVADITTEAAWRSSTAAGYKSFVKSYIRATIPRTGGRPSLELADGHHTLERGIVTSMRASAGRETGAAVGGRGGRVFFGRPFPELAGDGP